MFGTFNSVTDPFGVVRLAPRRFHEPALAAALALSIAPRTVAMAGRVREAQRLRGIQTARWRSLPALAVPVLETGMEEAVTLAESMDARGHGRGRRTRTGRSAGRGAAVVDGDRGGRSRRLRSWPRHGSGSGDLHPSTSPLEWPAAAPGLIAAIVLLAVPGVRSPRRPATGTPRGCP